MNSENEFWKLKGTIANALILVNFFFFFFCVIVFAVK